ncbi:cytidylate kinase-like family protein, partial [bacterium]|nr:cytidylate kinase-like family protein [bacterium]
MAIISIFSGVYCHGEAIADAVCRRLGWDRIDDELLDLASGRSGVSADRLASVMYGPPPFFNRLTREREKNLASLRCALAELVQRDDLVCHGYAGLLLPRRIAHVLQVCAIANTDYRIEVARETGGLSRAEAQKAIVEEDARRRRWTRWILDRDPYAGNMYDVVLAMQDTTVDAAVDIVEDSVHKPSVRTTDASRRAAADFLLAARVQQVLAARGYDVEADAADGDVVIGINKPVMRMGSLGRKLEAL